MLTNLSRSFQPMLANGIKLYVHNNAIRSWKITLALQTIHTSCQELINHIITYVVYGALERWMVTYLPGLCQAIQIHAVRIRECSLGLMIQDRHICYLDHT